MVVMPFTLRIRRHLLLAVAVAVAVAVAIDPLLVTPDVTVP
jgi:hypothetical protein